MNQLMVYDVPEQSIISFKWNDNAIFKEFCHAANSFFHIFSNNICLLKLVMRVIDDKRDTVVDFVSEQFFDRCIGCFRCIGSELCYIVPILRKVDIKVICLDILPVKIFVLDFILAKDRILRYSLHRHSAKNQSDENTTLYHTILISSKSLLL